MKIKFLRICMIAVLAVLTACTQDEEWINEPLPNNSIETIRVVAKDFEGVETVSRVSVEVGTEGASFAWADNDTIGIFPNTGYQVAFPMITGAGTQTANFSGGGWALKASSSYAAYYPFVYDNKDGRSIPVSYVGQFQKGDGTTSHIGAFDYMATSAVTPSEGNVTFEFQHLGALLQLKLIVPQAVSVTSLSLNATEEAFIRRGKVDLMSSQLSITPVEMSKGLSLELLDVKTTTPGQEITAYMMIPPTNLTGKGLSVSITDDAGNVAEAQLDSKNFEAGKIYALSATLGAFEPAQIQIADSKSKAVSATGGELVFEYLSNVECQVVVSEDAKEWIIPNVSSRALTKKSSSFTVAENKEKANRNATVIVRSTTSNLAVEYKIIQAGVGSYAITEENGRLPIGVLTAQYPAVDDVHGLDALFDNDLSTYYEVAQSAFYITWEGPDMVAVNCFGFGMAHLGANHAGDVSIEVSADGKSWNGIGWGALMGGEDGAHIAMFDNSTLRSKYYKLVVKSNHGGATTQFAEWYMGVDALSDADITTFDELVSRGSAFTQSGLTSMGTHYENKHVTTDADRTWLATATNEPELLPSSPGYTLRPYTVTLYPFGEPVPADINQHGVGDCSALAVFADMAYLFPDFIKSIITDHGDGTYTVAMFDPQGKAVDVTIQSTFLGDDNGLGATSGKNGEANWATVLEKAIMKWNYIYQVNPDIYGIGSEHVAPLFTGEGNSFAFSPNVLSPKQLKQAVEIALNNQMIVIGGFTQGDIDVGYGPRTVTAHAFSFMLSTDEDALFSMRNPWGNSPGGTSTDDGILNIFDNNVIPPLIDLRIIYPGAAKDYALKELSPYNPPQY